MHPCPVIARVAARLCRNQGMRDVWHRGCERMHASVLPQSIKIAASRASFGLVFSWRWDGVNWFCSVFLNRVTFSVASRRLLATLWRSDE